jgi:hypothetical protein
MREHGIHVEASTSGGGIHAHIGGRGPNPQSPGFQRAQSACQHLMPKPPGGGGGSGQQLSGGGK